MGRTDSLEKTLMLGKIEVRRRRERQRMRWLDGITNSTDMSLSKLVDGEGQGSLACCSPWSPKESDITEQLNNNSNIRGLHTLEGQSNEKCVCDKVCLPVCPSLATASTPQPVFYSVPQNLAQKSKKNPGKLNTVKV